MTKKQMLKEVKFPVLGPEIFNMQTMYNGRLGGDNLPSVGSWIFCFANLECGTTFPGIYKWQERDNPKNILGWCYMDIRATTGNIRYVEYKHLADDKIILVCDDRKADLVIKP